MMNCSAFQITESYETHPASWIRVATSYLRNEDVFAINEWLRQMTRGLYDIAGATRPFPHLIVFFEERTDAAMFKLAWSDL